MTTRKTIRVLAVATAILLGATAAASAEVKTYARSGVWDNYSGTVEDGDVVCGMSVSGGDNGDFRMINIKYYLASDAVRVEVFKESWRIPENTRLSVEAGFDDSAFGSIDGALGSTNKRGGVVYFTIAPDSLIDFFELFGSAKQMWLRFPGGNETTWTAKMNGSRDAVKKFSACMVKVSKSRPSQPFGVAPPSQPFGNGESKPSQEPQQPQQPYRGA